MEYKERKKLIKKLLLALTLMSLTFVTAAKQKTNMYNDGKTFSGEYGQLYYKTQGHGTPVVIINGGPGGNHSIFVGWFEFLTNNNYQVVFFDETGRGRATRKVEGRKLSPQMGVDDLESLRKELKTEKMIILAHSYGGIQGLQYALQYPQHVEKLLMVNASYDAESWEMNLEHVKDYTRMLYPERWQQLLKLREEGINSQDRRYARLLSLGADMYFKDPSLNKTKRKVKTGDKRDRFNYQAYLDIIGDDPEWQLSGTLSGLTVKNRLKSFAVPTLILSGRHDKITTPEIVYRLYKMMSPKHTQLVMLEDSGHWPWVESTEEFESKVTDFLSDKP